VATPDLRAYERALRKEGYEAIAGVDEAGRGPLAGAVVAACVIMPARSHPRLKGLTDSKQLTALQRDRFFDAIHDLALAVGVGSASCAEIDEVNILNATFLAMRRAIAQVDGAQIVLVDGNRAIKGLDLPQRTLVKGDSLSVSIAAASVVAKVTRDRQCLELHERYPAYGFDRHKGYGTAAHYAAIAEHGLTPHHRRSFLKGH
jgi:ribonuclease HII